MKLAPIVLFVYNRPLHTLMTLEALSKNDLANESTLYIYADGPKNNSTIEQREKIKETRDIIKSAQWCKEVVVIESEMNYGLANSIVKGVTEVVNKHGNIIVLEDDLLPSVGFLRYMNDALTIYASEDKVMHISGYVYPAKVEGQVEQTFFLNILSCWGWATWARAWKNYDHNVDDHMARFNTTKKIKKFNIEGHADYYHQLVLNKEKKLYSWAVRWYASWLYAGGFTLFPYKSLIVNNGFDSTGTNSKEDSIFNSGIVDHIQVDKIAIEENLLYRKAIDKFYAKAVPHLKIKVIHFLKRYVLFKLRS